MPFSTTHRRRVLAALLVVALACGLAVVARRPPAVGTVDPGMESDFVRSVNQERAARGLRALTLVNDLTIVAREHSATMARDLDLHHNPTLASDVTDWTRLSENVGVGYTTSSLHTAFMNSDGHRANIVDPEVTQIGVGVEVVSGRVWVTEVFRRPTSSWRDVALEQPDTHGSLSLPSNPARVPSGSRAVPLAGDWDGDGLETPGWFVDGTFHLSNHHDGTGRIRRVRFGRADDVPVVGDWNGNGRTTIGVVRGQRWMIRNDLREGAPQRTFTFGDTGRGDVPVVGDWNGRGRDRPGYVRRGTWSIDLDLRGGAPRYTFRFGDADGVPVVGDWDDDGMDTAGVVEGDRWVLTDRRRGGRAALRFRYQAVGSKGDLAVTGDWDGDGDTNVGVVRSGRWRYRLLQQAGAPDAVELWRPRR